jgi:hypothetical protein
MVRQPSHLSLPACLPAVSRASLGARIASSFCLSPQSRFKIFAGQPTVSRDSDKSRKEKQAVKTIIQVTAKIVLPLLLLFATAICAQAQQPPPPPQLNVGDVVVAVQGGYQVFSPAGGAPKATISAPTASDTMAGCAFDSTYRLRVADFSAAKVLKYAIPISPLTNSPQSTQTLTVSASPDSIVFDGRGHFFVGHAGGTIQEYDASGNPVGTSFTVKVDARTFISLDISADGNTLFYTSGGSTIRTFNLSTHATSKITVSGLNGSNLFGLRLLGPNFNGTSGFLAAIGTDVVSITGSGAIVNFYVSSVDGSSNNWRALAFAPDGAHFWAVNLATGHLFEFNITPPGKTAGPSTSASSDGGQSGVCVVGAFSAAQPQPILKTATLTPPPTPTSTSNFATLTFTTSGTSLSLGNSVSSTSTSTNRLNITVNSSSSVTVNAWFTEIDLLVGTSDPSAGSLSCLVVDTPSATPKCGVVKLELTPDVSANLGLLTSQTSINPVFLADEENSDTTFVVHGTTYSGGTKHSTVFSLQEQPLSPPAGGAVACGYQTPVTTSPSDFPNANTIPLKFSLASDLAHCSTPFTSPMTFVPEVSLVLLDPSGLTGTQELGLQTAGHSAPPYRFSPPSTWIVNIDTSTVAAPGCYIATTSEKGNQFASFSYSSQTNPATVIISIGGADCSNVKLP